MASPLFSVFLCGGVKSHKEKRKKAVWPRETIDYRGREAPSIYGETNSGKRIRALMVYTPVLRSNAIYSQLTFHRVQSRVLGVVPSLAWPDPISAQGLID